MIFLHPEFLYYMLPPLVILFALLLTQKEAQSDFFSKDVMNKLRVSANTLTLKARNALFLVVGVLMILALAQPVIKDGVVKVKAKSADIMIALDISDSMLAEDVYPNRLELAKQKILTLLDEAPNERIGVVAFAKNSYLVSPLSFDSRAVAFLLRQLDTKSITEKGTDFLSVIDIVSKSQKNKKNKYLLILSDGGDKSDFSAEIKKAKESGVKVFILGVGTKKGAPIKLENGEFIKYNGDIIVSKLNKNIVKLATSTGGVYIKSTTASTDIKTMFREITANSEQKELKTEEINRYIPLFYYPVALALFILLIAISSLSKLKSPSVSSVLVVSLLIFSNLHLEASMLDFVELKKAKDSYETGNYEDSAKIYESYANTTANGDSYYNAGNAFYKQKKYKKALESYKKATFKTQEERAKNYANMGNAYVKSNLKDGLQKAVESYEKSLKISEDKEVKENLEAVKKYIKKKKQEQKKNKEKEKDKKNKDKDKKNKDKDKKNKDKDKKSEDKDKKDSQKKSSNKDSSKSEKSEDKKQKEKKQKDGQSKSKDEKKEKQDLKDLSKQDKEKNKEKNKNNKTQKQQEPQNQTKMSEAEEQKWMKELNMNKNTYMYRLNKQNAKVNSQGERPW